MRHITAVNVLRQCRKEIADFPEEIRGEIADAAARLEEGHMLSMPLSRALPSLGKGVHELRFKDRSGIYRVVYVLIGGEIVWFIHAFQKKTEKMPLANIEIVRKRLKEIR